jgi:putative membrane protein
MIEEDPMTYGLTAILGAGALVFGGAAIAAEGPNDAQIAHIAYTAGNIDVAAAKQALAKSQSPVIREFASEMVRDHEAVNTKALELVTALKVTPEDNPTSQALSKAADDTMKKLAALDGVAFDRAYVDNEVAFHKTVNGALESTLIPSAQNEQLKSLLETGLTLFREHQLHAEHVASDLK